MSARDRPRTAERLMAEAGVSGGPRRGGRQGRLRGFGDRAAPGAQWARPAAVLLRARAAAEAQPVPPAHGPAHPAPGRRHGAQTVSTAGGSYRRRPSTPATQPRPPRAAKTADRTSTRSSRPPGRTGRGGWTRACWSGTRSLLAPTGAPGPAVPARRDPQLAASRRPRRGRAADRRRQDGRRAHGARRGCRCARWSSCRRSSCCTSGGRADRDRLGVPADEVGVVGGGKRDRARPHRHHLRLGGDAPPPPRRFGLLVVDEVHHLPAPTYRAIAEQGDRALPARPERHAGAQRTAATSTSPPDRPGRLPPLPGRAGRATGTSPTTTRSASSST